eukprot:scaffold922_cov156-Amphora_coffeaeformis.AAC.7
MPSSLFFLLYISRAILFRSISSRSGPEPSASMCSRPGFKSLSSALDRGGVTQQPIRGQHEAK